LLNAVYILHTVSFVITRTLHKASLTLVTFSPELSQLTYTLTHWGPVFFPLYLP
jgi:hypothetical protein